MKKTLHFILSIFIVLFFACNQKEEGGAVLESKFVDKKEEHPVTKKTKVNPRKPQKVNKPIDKCKANRDCVRWNVKNTKNTYYHDSIYSRQTKMNFVKYRFSPTCSSSKIIPNTFKLSFLQEYDSSQVKTEKFDGKVFCLNETTLDDNVKVRVLYLRNEGGHYSDQVNICTLSKDSTEQFILPILYEFGKDGYNSKVEGEILNEKFYKRTTYQEFGWPSPNGECPQAKRKTIQVYEVLNDGRFKLIEEEIQTQNFDIYFNE